MLKWSWQRHKQQTWHTRQHVCTLVHTHVVTICVRHVDSLLLCPVGVVAFMLASRSASEDLSGDEKTGTEVRKKKGSQVGNHHVTVLIIILTREECGVTGNAGFLLIHPQLMEVIITFHVYKDKVIHHL